MTEKLKILAILDRLIPSSILAIIKPMLQLQSEGYLEFKLRYTRFYREEDIASSDVVVLCRNMRPDDLNILSLIKKYRVKLVYDIDDNFFELPVNSPVGQYHRLPPHLFTVSEFLKYADAVRVYSKPMEEIARTLNNRVYRLKSYFDMSLLDGKVRPEPETLKIVYATSRGNDDMLAREYLPAIAKILEEYPNTVEFCAFGYIPEQLRGFSNVKKLNYISNYTKFIEYFYEQGFTIGLAPLLDDVVHNSKTNNKFREYGAMGVCGIYSNAQIYQDCVRHEENGMLVENNTKSWYEALKRLIEDEVLRSKIQENAKRAVMEEYSFDNTLEDWKQVLQVPPSDRTEYHNILRLKVAMVYDSNSAAAMDRMHQLTYLLDFCQIYHECVAFTAVKLLDVKKNDCVVCFAPNDETARDWISFFAEEVESLIIDTPTPFDATEFAQREGLVFSHATQPDGASLLSIPDCIAAHEINPRAYGILKVVNGGEGTLSEYMCWAEQVSEELREIYFSRNSPSFQWAEILTRYEGSYVCKRPNPVIAAMTRVGLKIGRLIMKPLRYLHKKICVPIVGKVNAFTNYVRYLIGMAEDYIRINKKKKY